MTKSDMISLIVKDLLDNEGRLTRESREAPGVDGRWVGEWQDSKVLVWWEPTTRTAL